MLKRREPDAQAEAEKHLAYWRGALGLHTWDIGVDVRHAIHSPNGEAEVDVVWESETARIHVLHPESYRDRGMLGDQDIEHAVVHELLHILLDPIEPDDRKGLVWRVFEQVLDRVARTLVAVRHG